MLGPDSLVSVLVRGLPAPSLKSHLYLHVGHHYQRVVRFITRFCGNRLIPWARIVATPARPPSGSAAGQPVTAPRGRYYSPSRLDLGRCSCTGTVPCTSTSADPGPPRARPGPAARQRHGNIAADRGRASSPVPQVNSSTVAQRRYDGVCDGATPPAFRAFHFLRDCAFSAVRSQAAAGTVHRR